MLAEQLQSYVQLGLFVLSIGLSILAAKLLAPKKQAGTPDAPTTLATRGSFIQRVLGRRKVAAVFGWAGERASRKEGGKSGFLGVGAQKGEKVWTEMGWHLLAVGPGQILHEIEQAGKIIFKGPITNVSHPSGSFISLGGEGGFFIFWGEVDQPINFFLGGTGVTQSNATGVFSRWPNLMYIDWRGKRLGTSPVWPALNYDIEIAPSATYLSDTPSSMLGDFVLDGQSEVLSAIPILDGDSVVNGAEGTGLFRFTTLQFREPQPAFFTGGKVRLTGNTNLADQDFDILKVEHDVDFVFPNNKLRSTRVYPVGGLSGASVDGNIQAYTTDTTGGYNLAHLLADLWFSAWPHGIKKSQSLFDMPSLEALGTLMATEDLRGSLIASEGKDLRTLFATVHQDMGTLLPYNFRTGKLQFVSIREPSGPLPNLPADALVKVTETEVRHGPNKVDRLLFTFPDQENRFREQPIGIDDAGHVSRQEFFRARTVPIESTVLFPTAAKIAERRSQEEVNAVTHKLSSNRAARLLLPGTQITADGIAEVLLVTAVTTDPLSGLVVVDCIPDFLGAKASAFIAPSGNPLAPVQLALPDLMFKTFEIPEWISGAFQTVAVLRVRAHNQITGAVIHISRDDSTFETKTTDLSNMQGGDLTTAIAIDDLHEQDLGPIFDSVGPDIANVLDLSADLVSWRNGRQMVCINDELFFLKTIDSLGGDSYQMRGLIRARYDTRPVAHAIGSDIYIFQNDDGAPINDVLIVPQVTLYMKSQAFGNGATDLGSVDSDDLALYGKGVRPVPVSDIRFDTLSDPAGVSTHSWVGTGSTDLDITWGYFTPQSTAAGAGFSGAGTPQFPAPPEGEFLVEILDSGDSLIRSVTVATNDYTYTETDRLADFSAAEPAIFKVRVTQLRAGLLADPVTQTFTRI